MGNLLSDVRFCLRGFARRPMFAVVVVATLALGLSINAAIFSIYDQVLLRELPVPAPDGLVNFGSPGPQAGQHVVQRRRHLRRDFQLSRCSAISSASTGRSSALPRIATSRRISRSTARRRPAAGLLVSGQYFSLLGVRPAVGRLLDTNDDRVDGEASAVVLSYAYWESAFGADPAVVGRDARRQRQAADDRRRRAARLLRHDRRRAAARVRADHVPLAVEPERVPEARGSQELLGVSVRALEARRLARASGRGDQRAVPQRSPTTSTRRC